MVSIWAHQAPLAQIFTCSQIHAIIYQNRLDLLVRFFSIFIKASNVYLSYLVRKGGFIKLSSL